MRTNNAFRSFAGRKSDQRDPLTERLNWRSRAVCRRRHGWRLHQMSDRPEIEIQRQTVFGDDGQLEVTETSVETSLNDFGADVDHRERDSRLGRPEASEFGVDDRPEVE